MGGKNSTYPIRNLGLNKFIHIKTLVHNKFSNVRYITKIINAFSIISSTSVTDKTQTECMGEYPGETRFAAGILDVCH